MSERAINDPAAGGWELNPDTGYWMWAAEGGGSIQDGDTEGQITTWDGTEWTPEGAVVVADGLEIDGAVIAEGGLTQGHRTNSGVFQYGGNLTRIRSYGETDGTGEFAIEVGGGGGNGPSPALSIDADGNVNITGKLFINGEEVSAGGSSYTAGNGITIDGDTIKMSGSYSGTFTANTVVGSG